MCSIYAFRLVDWAQMADFAPSPNEGRSGATLPPASRTRKWNAPHENPVAHCATEKAACSKPVALTRSVQVVLFFKTTAAYAVYNETWWNFVPTLLCRSSLCVIVFVCTFDVEFVSVVEGSTKSLGPQAKSQCQMTVSLGCRQLVFV